MDADAEPKKGGVFWLEKWGCFRDGNGDENRHVKPPRDAHKWEWVEAVKAGA